MKLVKSPNKIVFKLMALVLLLSVTIALGFYWISSRDIGSYIRRTLFPNLQQHVVYVIADVRRNVNNLEYVTELANRLNMDIAVSSRGNFWSTSIDIDSAAVDNIVQEIKNRKKVRPLYSRSRNKDFDDHGKLERTPWLNLARRDKELRHGNFFSLPIGDKPSIIYSEPKLQIILVYRETLLPFTEINYLKLLAWLILLMLISFAIIYRIMRPLKDLRKGVQAIEQGIYDDIIPQKSKDELGTLVRSFNSMSSSVSEQIRRKDQLLYDMSHELRSPLARMKVALEFLSDSNAKKMIADDVLEQETIIEELLETARLKNQRMQLKLIPTNLIKLIGDTIAKRQLRRIHFDFSSDSIEVCLDQVRIERVLNNLLDNAIKYSPSQSPITISVEQQEGYIRVKVINTGVAINEADKERIFEPFYRLDSSRTRATGGYGLGLSLCRQIIDAHQGHIFADTNEKKGLAVVFTLPC